MIKKKDRIENPITKETFLYRQTAQDTGGELLQIDVLVKPGGFAAAPHIHPRQEERFRVKSGTIRLRVNDNEQVLGPGQEAVISAGTPHVWWNAGGDDLEAVMEFHPAMQIQEIFPTLFALASDGLTDKEGMPGLLQTAVTLDKYRDQFYLASFPIAIQKVLFAILAPIARLFKYTPDYPDCPAEAASRLGRLESPHYSGC